MDEIINDMNEVTQNVFQIDIENNFKEDEKEIYHNRYVLFNNNKYSDIVIKFNKFNMYINFKILSKFSKFFESKQNFEYNNKIDDKIIIIADDIYHKYLPVQQTLTWFYFQYKDIIRPIDYDYVSLFYLNNYLIIYDEFLTQIIEMIFEVRNNSIFYRKLYDGFKECLLDENTIINIHKFITNKKEIFDIGFKINGNNESYCSSCGHIMYCCIKCERCERHCKCKNLIHAILYIFPSLWLTTINEHKYPIDILNFRKCINQNIYNQKIDIKDQEVNELLFEIKEQIEEIKISINIIFGKT